MQLMNHQEATASFWVKNPKCFNTSDPGTGKTIASLEGYKRSLKGKMLVLAPLSILKPSWGNDIEKYLTGFTYIVAHGNSRVKAFKSDADIVITNHDAVNWIVKDLSLLDGFSHLVIDEFTAFKNRSAKRSKALGIIARHFEYKLMLSGTPNSNHITDIYYPAYLLDGGMRLGSKFFSFRDQVCSPIQVGPRPEMKEWREKDGARDMVADLLKDITIRFTREECIDLPDRTVTDLLVEMPAAIMKQYEELKQTSYLETENGEVNAIHAGAKVKKLLQLLSGAIYDEDGNPVKIHTTRYELVMELAAEREQCVVVFNWRHEREALNKLADKYKFSFSYIDGSVPQKDRNQVVDDFQAGKTKIIAIHPQAAGHGLTLTAATTTIWCTPTYSAEHYEQANSRAYRKGQQKKSEIIRIAAADTAEVDVYEKLDGKVTRMSDLLALFSNLTKARDEAYG